ncbi:MAG: hypothetical protein IKU71_03675 [Kiritimatiellae bacterium]|nr:hypothetical protein [Kiritimatiellia bacterium]
MKKLMIAASVAAMAIGSYANTCVTMRVKDECGTVDLVEGGATAHKIAISLKTTKLKSSTKANRSDCTSSCTYWREQGTKKINGAIWMPLDSCDVCTMDFEGQTVALWDENGAIDADFAIGVGFIGKAKNSKKVEAYGAINGDDFGELAYGAFGTVVAKNGNCGECAAYVKSLTGGIAGKLVPADYNNNCVECDPIAYEGCCDDKQLEYTAAYGTIKISYDTALAKKVIANVANGGDGSDAVASLKGAPLDIEGTDVVIEE